MAERRFRIIVCRGPECGDRRNSRAVHAAFAALLAERRLEGRCELSWQSCFGRCSQGPNALVREVPAAVQPAPRFSFADLPPSHGGGPRLATALYNRLDPVKAAEIVATHIEKGVVVSRLIERPVVGATTAVASILPSPPTPPDQPPGDPDDQT